MLTQQQLLAYQRGRDPPVGFPRRWTMCRCAKDSGPVKTETR
jgi:hypothetical protein